MMTRSQTAAWAGGKITGLGIWGARGESADSLADRTGALLATLDAVLGTRQWLLTDDRPFPSEPAARAATVEEFVSRDAHGDLTPDAGVSFALFSGETEVAVTLEFFVGTASRPGGWRPTGSSSSLFPRTPKHCLRPRLTPSSTASLALGHPCPLPSATPPSLRPHRDAAARRRSRTGSSSGRTTREA